MEQAPSTIETITSKERLKELEESGNYVFHGTTEETVSLEPRQAYTDIEGVPTPRGNPSVFASHEIEIPIFRSIFHESRYRALEGSYSVGFADHEDGHIDLYANEAVVDLCKDVHGFVYVFDRNQFNHREGVEWISEQEVRPVAVFKTTIADIGLPIQPPVADPSGNFAQQQ